MTKRSPPKDEDSWCKESLEEEHEPAQADCIEDKTQPTIAAGEGWGPVRIRATSSMVDAFLGGGKPGEKYSGVYFKDYPRKGVQVSFENTTDTVHAIYFYNKERDNEHIGIFCGHTNNGINLRSRPPSVRVGSIGSALRSLSR